jgi:hypothetical protein
MPHDNSRWVVPGRPEPLRKGQFLLAIFEDYIADKLPLPEIQRVFRDLSEASNVGNRHTFKLRDEVKDTTRFHVPPIRTADRQLIRVSTQWRTENFSYVLKAVHQHFRIPLQGCGLTDKMRNSLRAAGVSWEEVNC